MKTTNPKARLNQTPAAPGTLKPEKTNKRTSTQKVKKLAPLVQQNDTEVVEEPAQDDVPDIEYMPPKPQGGNSDFVLMKGLLLISCLCRASGHPRRHYVRHNVSSIPTKEPGEGTGEHLQ